MSEPSFAFEPHVASMALGCCRCSDIGIQTPTIMPGNDCMKVIVGGKIKAFCCMDCFARLAEEIQQATKE